MAEQKQNNVQTSPTAQNIGEKSAMIENTAALLKQHSKEQNKKFDEDGFRAAATVYLQSHDTLAGFDTSAYLLKKEDTYGTPGYGFKLKEENGQIIAIGTDGTVIRGNSFEEINDKVCQNFKQKSIAEGKEPKIGFNSSDPQKQQIFAHDAIIKHHMTISKGGPQDPQFWQNLKQEFLADKNNTPELWERLTRNIPDDIMLRSPEEKERNDKLLRMDSIDRLRGTNSFAPRTTNMSPVQPSAATIGLQASIGIDKPQEAVADSLSLPGVSKQNDKNIIAQMRMGVNPYLEQNSKHSATQTPSVAHQLTPEMVQQLRKQRQI